jgi:seryl-tRNA synthetase
VRGTRFIMVLGRLFVEEVLRPRHESAGGQEQAEMLDIKRIVAEKDEIERLLRFREPGIQLGNVVELDAERRELITRVETLKAERNAASKAIGNMVKEGGDVAAAKARVSAIGDEIKSLDEDLKRVEDELHAVVADLPNIPAADTPLDLDKANNVVVKTYGDAKAPAEIGPYFKDHIELGKLCNGLDFERGAKLSGTNFALYRNDLAHLEWGLVFWLIDVNVGQFGHELIIPPYVVNDESMYSSAQYPKFTDQAYRIEKDGLALIPTGEVPLLNMFRDEKLDENQLPIRLCAFTPCFRREAGTYGRDERGLIRVHQFHKVEMFSFTVPEESDDELQRMTKCAEQLMEMLGLPYRTTLLVAGDLATQSAKTYDIEGWIPGQGKYYEISSCSDCTDYQARRANIRFRREGTKKLEYVHTLNGSALATSRLMISIMEHNQRADGTIEVPEVIRPYIGGKAEIKPA